MRIASKCLAKHISPGRSHHTAAASESALAPRDTVVFRVRGVDTHGTRQETARAAGVRWQAFGGFAACDFARVLNVEDSSAASLETPKPSDDPLITHWSTSPNENKYNDFIRWGVQDRWGAYQPPLPPLLLKSLIRQESDFDPRAVSPSGYAGLTQLGVEAARAEGLIVNAHTDERFDPKKSIHAGIGILQRKLDVMLHPESIADKYPFARKVVQAYNKYGRPSAPTVIWTLGLAAYNGGQGTLMRAMARAFDANLNPLDWNSLIQPDNDPEKSPLYGATLEVFGPERAMTKYKEMSKYPLQILARAPQGDT